MKTTWILTTGNSDIQLKTDKKWTHLYSTIKSQCNRIPFTTTKGEDKRFLAPARVLGLVYSQNLEERYSDLVFPLIDGFASKFKNEGIKPDRIILLLTNQEHLFEDRAKQGKTCPYWQDTCTAQPIFEKYFQEHEWLKGAELVSLTLEPLSGEKGLDSWDSALPLVEKTLDKASFEKDEIIYVSHQAGTPAISSALQFVSLGQFDNRVSFLVGNEYNPEDVEILESSTYLRGIQIQKAKKLITGGFPGAALELLKTTAGVETQMLLKLQRLVDVFNIKSTARKDLEFQPDNAIERVRKALDLIEIFFEQENYLQGITLLAAAQETFLKAATFKLIREKQPNRKMEWKLLGFDLDSKKQSNSELLEELRKLVSFPNWEWKLLTWSCIYKRTPEFDRRNQLMHNLRGVEKKDAIEYLYGNPQNKDHINYTQDVRQVYIEQVQNKFVSILSRLGWKQFGSIENKLQQELKDLADKLK